MSTLAEIEEAIDKLPTPAQRELLESLAAKLEAQVEEFPDLKAILLDMPNVGEDADFARVREMPRDLDLS
jgi:hypothetical protein